MQGTQFRYVIKFVADMNKAVKFYRDVLGLQLKFESSGWSEFVTGETTLALHPASEKNPAGKVELGFTVADVEAFYRDMSAKGVLFSMPPKKQDFGGVLAQFVDSEGAHCSVGAGGIGGWRPHFSLWVGREQSYRPLQAFFRSARMDSMVLGKVAIADRGLARPHGHRITIFVVNVSEFLNF